MTATTDKTYNGWTNYETWGVALILDNDEGTYSYVRERAQEIKETEGDSALYALEDFLKDYTETLCGIGNESEDYGIPEPTMMARQLLGGAISDVDFREIAENILSES